MGTETSRLDTIAALCGSVLAACSVLRVECVCCGSDWIAVAERTNTLAWLEGVTPPIFDLSSVTEITAAQYCERQAGGLVHFVLDRHIPLADEIAYSAERAARRSRLCTSHRMQSVA